MLFSLFFYIFTDVCVSGLYTRSPPWILDKFLPQLQITPSFIFQLPTCRSTVRQSPQRIQCRSGKFEILSLQWEESRKEWENASRFVSFILGKLKFSLGTFSLWDSSWCHLPREEEFKDWKRMKKIWKVSWQKGTVDQENSVG